MERTILSHRQYDEESALYHLQHADVHQCVFAGRAYGESALKEARDVRLTGCRFSLRYPLWHVRGFHMADSVMDEKTRAAIWYAQGGEIVHCQLNGVKAVRECRGIQVRDSQIVSPEFGWKSTDISLTDTDVESEYLFLDSRQVKLKNVRMKGKYSFQYVDGLEIDDSVLDTKDAFWHSKNATVRNSTVKGEYLAWYSDGLTLINCTIIGTQPLCYCTNLKLVHCTLQDADLSFEYSDVNAEIEGHVISIKNPRSGRIVVDSVGEIIREDPVVPCTGEVVIR